MLVSVEADDGDGDRRSSGDPGLTRGGDARLGGDELAGEVVAGE